MASHVAARRSPRRAVTVRQTDRYNPYARATPRTVTEKREVDSFEACSGFQGDRPGWLFKRREHGHGYYLDKPPQQPPERPPEQPPEQSPGEAEFAALLEQHNALLAENAALKTRQLHLEIGVLRTMIDRLRRSNGDRDSHEELVLREQLRMVRAGAITVQQSRRARDMAEQMRLGRATQSARDEMDAVEDAETNHEAEMSEEAGGGATSDDEYDAVHFKSTREHLTNAEQAIKLAMSILDDIKEVTGVAENDYLGAANAMGESFASVTAVLDRLVR